MTLKNPILFNTNWYYKELSAIVTKNIEYWKEKKPCRSVNLHEEKSLRRKVKLNEAVKCHRRRTKEAIIAELLHQNVPEVNQC